MTPSARLFSQTANVAAPTVGQETGTGAATMSWGAGTDYSCSIQPVSASEVASMGRDFSEGVTRGYFYNTVSIPPHSQITVGGVKYRTIGVARSGAGRATYVEVLMVTESIVNV